MQILGVLQDTVQCNSKLLFFVTAPAFILLKIILNRLQDFECISLASLFPRALPAETVVPSPLGLVTVKTNIFHNKSYLFVVRVFLLNSIFA